MINIDIKRLMMSIKSKDPIQKEMTIQEVLHLDEDLAEVFMGFGMFCVFCQMGSQETIEQACKVHEIEMPFLLEKLNDAYAKKQN